MSDDNTIITNCVEGSSMRRQILAAVVCNLLTTMYGISVTWTSIAMTKIEAGILSDGPINIELLGWLGGAFYLGALFCSPFIGLLADARGRKFTGYIAGLCFAINWAIILFTNTYAWVMVARVIAGIAGASSLTVVSIYNNEIAELKVRTSIGGILALSYVVGMETSYILGVFLEFKTVAIVCLCFSLVWLPIWWMLPETPAHLILNGHEKTALITIQWLREVDADKAQKVLNEIKSEQEGAINSATIKEFFSDPVARRGLLLVAILVTFQTYSGSSALNTYSASIFGKAGGGLTTETGVMVFGASMIVGAIIPPLLSNRAPRKVLLCLSSFLMACGMITFGTIQLFKSWMTPEEEEAYSSILPPIVLSLTTFSYFMGLGSIPYITSTELFSDENRGVAGACISIVIWITTFILVQFYGVAVETFGDYVTFYCFACMLLSCFLFVFIFLPETKGKSFPEIKKLIMKE